MKNNSFQSILVVTLVFIGFLLITNRCNKTEADGNAATELTDAADGNAATGSVTMLDSIRPADVRYAADYIRQAGVTDPATGITSLSLDNVSLSVSGDEVGGTINLDGGKQVSYADVVSSNFPADLSLAQKCAAANSLRSFLDKAGRYQSFARYIEPGKEDAAPVKLSNDVLSLEFSPKGGIISRATLLKYYTYFPDADNKSEVDTANVEVFRPQDNATYSFTLRTISQQEIDTRDLYFTPKQVNDSTVEMILDLEGGAQWGYRYTLRPGKDYVVGMEIVQRNITAIMPPSAVTAGFHWHMTMPRQERGRTFEERNSAVYYKYVGDRPDDLNSQKSTSEKLDHSVRWIAYKNQFFSTVFIPRKPFEGGAVAQAVIKDSPDYLKDMDAIATVTYDNKGDIGAAFDIYIGPNSYPVLRSIDDRIGSTDKLDLTRLIPLGWSWLRWINTLIIIPIFTFLSGFISNYGVIILILTLFIKLILFPFTYKSYQSQAKMRVLAPEIKEINDKYPGQENAMVRQQKTMALYSRAGASPFSGCLPLMLQMPILIAMFSFFPSCIELRGESFLWAKNLAAPDVIATLPFSIPFYGNHVSLFCLLMTATNVVYTYINMKSQPTSSTMPGMKWMMYMMPVMFLFFFNDYASALSYYYFLSLLITIIQTWAFRRCIDEKKLRKKMMENAAKPKKKSGFMARLEEAQRRQQQMLREQQKSNQRRR